MGGQVESKALACEIEEKASRLAEAIKTIPALLDISAIAAISKETPYFGTS